MQPLGRGVATTQRSQLRELVGSSTTWRFDLDGVYPWAQYQLQVLFPLPVPRLRIAPRMSPPISPFPRHGHAMAINQTSSSGDILLFGGLAVEKMQNDLYVISVQDHSATLLDTTGDLPDPRTGHACVLMSDVFVVWGGDSDSPATREELSHEVCVLDLLSRAWTRFLVGGSCPAARCGHTLTALGSKLYMYGGSDQKDAFNDMWTFDIGSLRTAPSWEAIKASDGSPCPSKRANHSSVLLDAKIILSSASL
ncbi:galactose oxidase [Cubamyces sp. BRFM 1775]|nr:galactose oxidase [Cubamyces sp. BRFM 1775]